MAATKTTKNKIINTKRSRNANNSCWFCENNIEPDYKEVEIIKSFLSPRGKILNRRISGTCAKHQRKLAKAIKIARLMALIR